MTRRTQYQGLASSRRREARAHSEASNSSEELHRPTPSRAVMSLKRDVVRPEPTSATCRNGDCGEPSVPGTSYCCCECREDAEKIARAKVFNRH